MRGTEGKSCAVWVAPNLEYSELDPPANPHRKSWTRPHPDVVGYAHRDHANRVGHWRMAEVMTRHGFPGSVSLSVALCDHIPEVVEDARQRGWEFFSHGIYNTRYSYGMDEAQERAIIEDSIATVQRATGQRIRGWLAPALTHTPRPPDPPAAAGSARCRRPSRATASPVSSTWSQPTALSWSNTTLCAYRATTFKKGWPRSRDRLPRARRSGQEWSLSRPCTAESSDPTSTRLQITPG